MTKSVQDRVRVVRRGIDRNGNHYLEIAVITPDKEERCRLFRMAELNNGAEPFFKFLGDAGLAPLTSKERTEILNKLRLETPDEADPVATRPGWDTVKGEHFYASPWGTVYAPGTADVGLSFDKRFDASKWQKAGKLADWTNLMAFADGRNTLIVFCVAQALGAVLLRLLKRPNCMFVLRGKSTTGKSTILTLAGSVWGGRPDTMLGYKESWLHTTNNFDNLMWRHSDNLLILDDIGQADEQGKQVADAVFRLATGVGKGRMTDEGPVAEARFALLTSSNVSLADLFERHGQWIDRSHHVRLVEIPVQRAHGGFDVLPPGKTAPQFANELKAKAEESFGRAIRAFLTHLVEELSKDPDGFVERIEKSMSILRGRLQASDEPAEARIRDHFLPGYAAIRLARQWGIIPWAKEEIVHAFEVTYAEHRRLAILGADSLDPVALLRAYTEAFTDTCVDLSAGSVGDEEIGKATWFKNPSAPTPELLFPHETFVEIFEDKIEVAKKILRQKKKLIHGSERHVVKRMVLGKRRTVYAVDASILD